MGIVIFWGLLGLSAVVILAIFSGTLIRRRITGNPEVSLVGPVDSFGNRTIQRGWSQAYPRLRWT
jgi:hypothetical protein